MKELREKLKNQNYGNPPRPLLPGEKAIFDRLPPNADENILKNTARLLEICVQVYWSEEELSEDDFNFFKELYDNRHKDEEKKIFQGFEIEGVGNQLTKIHDFLLKKNDLKHKEKELEEINRLLEEKQNDFKKQEKKVEDLKKILKVLKKKSNGERNNFSKQLEKEILRGKLRYQCFRKERFIDDIIKNEAEKEEFLHRYEIRESTFKETKKLKEPFYLDEEWRAIDEEGRVIDEEEAIKLQDEYEKKLQSWEGETFEIKRHRIFRHEFLDVIAYRFMELFWEAEDDEKKFFYDKIRKNSFFAELRQNDLPEDYFKKGWKPERSVPDDDDDKKEIAEVERIFKKIFTVERWKWYLNTSITKDKEAFEKSIKFYEKTGLFLVPGNIEDNKEVGEKEIEDFYDSFILSEQPNKNLKESYERFFSNKDFDERNFPNNVLELKEIFFFFEKVFPEKNKENNPLNELISNLLEKYYNKHGWDFSVWWQTMTVDSHNAYGEENEEWNNKEDYYWFCFDKAYLEKDYSEDFRNSEIIIEWPVGKVLPMKEIGGFVDLFYYFYDPSIRDYSQEFEWKYPISKKTKAGTKIESLACFMKGCCDGFRLEKRRAARSFNKCLKYLKKICEKLELDADYYFNNNDIRSTLVAIIFDLTKHLDEEFSKMRSKLQEAELETSLRKEIRSFYEDHEKKIENYIKTNVETSFSINYSIKFSQVESKTYLLDLWEPFHNLIDKETERKEKLEKPFEEAKNRKKDKKREISKLSESLEKENRILNKLPHLIPQQSSQDDEKTESFSQFIFRLDSLGHQIFWTGFFLVTANVSAALYFYWEKIMAWWNKPLFKWALEEEDKGE